MMMFPTVDIPTLYEVDNTIFDDFVYPDLVAQDGTKSAMTDEEKQNLIDEILMETEKLESLYTKPSVLKNRIRIFTNLNKVNWERYSRTESFIGSYNPTENVFEEATEEDINSKVGNNTDLETRGLETIKSNVKTNDNTDTETKDLDGFVDHTHTNDKETVKYEKGLKKTVTTKDNEANIEMTEGVGSGQTSGSISVGSNDMGSGSFSGSIPIDRASAKGSKNEVTEEYTGTFDTDTHERSGSNKDEYEDNGTDTHVVNGESTEADVTNEGGTVQNDGELTEAETHEHTNSRHGNIGVSTSASIMREEFELVTIANLHKQIIKDFKRKFCVLVY